MTSQTETNISAATSVTPARVHGGRRTQPGFHASKTRSLLTVVTVTYNCAASIEATILSVINQSRGDIEYIIVDGGSTDGTLQIIQKYEQEVDYWISEKDSGIYNAMNKGIDLSTGTWINFMNSGDCFYCSKTIENIANHLDEGFAIVAGGVRYIYDSRNSRIKYMRLKFSGFYMEVPHHQASFINNTFMKALKYDESFKIRADLNLMALLHAKGHQFRLVDQVICDVETNGVSSGLSIRHIVEDIRAGRLVINNYGVKSSIFHALYIAPRLMARKMLPKRLESRIRSLIGS